MTRDFRNQRTLGLLTFSMIAWLAGGCPSVPRSMPQTPRSVAGASKPGYSYRVHLVPLYQELGVPLRVDQLEKLACYAFTMAALDVDALFHAAIDKVPFRSVKPRVVLDPRIKLLQQGTSRALVITADQHVLAFDGPYVYRLERAVVKRAVAAILAAAPRHTEKGSGCFPAEPPPGWGETSPNSCH